MVIPALILVLSLAGVAVALLLPEYGDLLLLAGPCAVAALILWLRAAFTRKRHKPNWILIDGSNVMHWKDNSPQIETLREVIAHLRVQRHTPAVIFDANVGYLLTGKYQDDYVMAKSLGLPEDRVLVVPKGTIADSYLLTVARDYNAPIVTNDRYRDWADDYPEIAEQGRLIRGGYRNRALWLEGMEAPAPA
ncbi:NYN domain-containing protein [Roseovarius sp. S1116L3]|uniref:NYN domain-containing protein n=1 Tax=Roseovarius roseus TaxID=3342636 RepID=UPI00372ACEA5